MQYNFLGGQSQRDTLTAALGQRNPVLDAQLDFSKNAFITGVQGVGQTARTAMSLAQQQQESLLRAKTTREEGALSRASALDTLTKRMEFDKSQAAEATAQRQADIEAAIAQRKIEREEASALRREEEEAKRAAKKADLDDARTRDKEEYDRRVAEAIKAKELGVRGKLDAALSAYNQELGLDDDDHRFDDYEEGLADIKNPLTGEVIGQRKSYSSKTRQAMEKHRDDLLAQINATSEPNERAALIESLLAGNRLTYSNVRGVLDGNWNKKQQKKKQTTEPKAGGTDAASTASYLSN